MLGAGRTNKINKFVCFILKIYYSSLYPICKSRIYFKMASDFSVEFFTDDENQQFATILARLRLFEAAVAREFRTIGNRLGAIEDNVRKQRNSLTATKGSITKMRNGLKTFEKNVNKKFATVKSVLNVELDPDSEEDDDEDEEQEEGDHESEGDGTDGEEGEENADVYIADPFASFTSLIGTYDGNPSISFSSWVQKFMDVLSLSTNPLTEEQKLARLRFLLAGTARTAYDNFGTPPATLEIAINSLRGIFENGNARALARQSLSVCRQAPGEPVFAFASRLNEVVRSALGGRDRGCHYEKAF